MDIDNTPAGTEPEPRRRGRSIALVGTGLLAGGILAGTLTATAATDEASPSTSVSTSVSTSAGTEDGGRHGGPGDGDPSQAQHPDEELLTGDALEQVTAAALAAP